MRWARGLRPAALPIAATLLQEHLRLDGFSEAELSAAERYGLAAGREIEDYGQLALLLQPIHVSLDGWPDTREVALPVGPVPSDGGVTASADGQALNGVELVTGRRPALRLTAELTAELRAAEIKLQYDAGFGDEAADVPADLALAVADHAATLFDMRGGAESKAPALSPHAARIAARYRGVAL